MNARPSAASSWHRRSPRRAQHRLPARRYLHRIDLWRPRRSLPAAPPAGRAVRHIAQQPPQKHDPPRDSKAARHRRHPGAVAAARVTLWGHRSCQSRHPQHGKRHKARQPGRRCGAAEGRMRRGSFWNHPPAACCKPQDLRQKYRSVQTCVPPQVFDNFLCFSHFLPSGAGSGAHQAPQPKQRLEWRYW